MLKRKLDNTATELWRIHIINYPEDPESNLINSELSQAQGAQADDFHQGYAGPKLRY
jgi:hypothetical protein